MDKPAGLLVVPGRTEGSPTVRAALEAQLGRPVWVCHRLDRDTSGVLLLALDAQHHRDASRAFELHQAQKAYLALVEGRVEPEVLTLDGPIAPARRGRSKVANPGTPGAREARTQVTVLERFATASLVEARPLTGRHHQVRVHLASAGHRLLVEPQYGGPSSWPADTPVLLRTPLHASRLVIPSLGVNVSAPLPEDLRLAVEHLKAG